MIAAAPPGMALQKRMSGIPVLVDVELRFRIMDRYDGYVQVLTLANPPIEVVAGPALSPELARLANDEMRSEEHTSELQSQSNLVCRLLLEKKKKKTTHT